MSVECSQESHFVVFVWGKQISLQGGRGAEDGTAKGFKPALVHSKTSGNAPKILNSSKFSPGTEEELPALKARRETFSSLTLSSPCSFIQI